MFDAGLNGIDTTRPVTSIATDGKAPFDGTVGDLGVAFSVGMQSAKSCLNRSVLQLQF